MVRGNAMLQQWIPGVRTGHNVSLIWRRVVMEKARLRRLLEDLHRELSGATAVDPDSRRMLDQVLRDIQHLTGETPGEVPDGATAQLREAALRIEAEHPRLASALGQLSDALAKLGI
jgi:hypothetical protein